MWLRPAWHGLIGLAARCQPAPSRFHHRRQLTLEPLEDRMLMSVFTVDRLTDDGTGSGLTGDLRYCITNATSGADTITFGVTGTITISSSTGPLPPLEHSVRIEGPGADLVTVDGAYLDEHVFVVSGGATVTIHGLTITRGFADSYGGGILNAGNLTLLACTISGNDVEFDGQVYGGGIYNSGTLTIRDSTISGNSAEADLGDGNGAGIYNDGTLTLLNSTVADNYAWGFEFGSQGGGIANYGMLTIRNSTVSDNAAAKGGGIRNSGILDMRDTILADNGANPGPDLYGNLASSGYNLIGKSSGGSGYAPTDLLDVDPMLGPLADNGGPTQTMALLPGSPAIAAADITGAPRWDQRGRGYHRIVNGTIDIGAFEVQPGGVRNAGSAALGQAHSLRTSGSFFPPEVGVTLTQPEKVPTASGSADRSSAVAALVWDELVIASVPTGDSVTEPADHHSLTNRSLSYGLFEFVDWTCYVAAMAPTGFIETRGR
jgi:hypothetical protein